MNIRLVDGKGQHYEFCICKHNIDLSTGCPSGNNNGKFERNSSNRCDYCYGRLNNYFKFKPKNFNYNLIERDIEKRKAKIIRIGKFADPGFKKVRSQLKNILELCLKKNIRAIAITKLLEFDQEISELFKKTK